MWVPGDPGHGASHGSPVESDAHVPVLFRGAGVKPGIYFGEASPVDIAPTLSALTGVEFTPMNEGRVLTEAISLGGAVAPAKQKR